MSSAKGRNGVLPISPSLMRKPAPAQSQPKAAQKAASPKLRLIIRRLPPGLTEAEFWALLGDEWKSGAGKVDWSAFKEGKISKDPAKPSKPGRAYLRVKEHGFLDALSAKVRQTTFQDAKNTTKDPCLLAPPSVEFAPLNRVPGGRIRHDGRQGTIDQDQEFIDFLQSLTEPIIKPGAQGNDGGDPKSTKTTTTPLVQFIKEKKAAKAKEVALAKNAKARQDGKDAKGSKSDQKSNTATKTNASSATEKTRVTKVTQETVKAINKSAGVTHTKGNPQKTENKVAAVKDTSAAAQAPVKRERERGNASVAARILQRDLGLAPKESRAARALRNAGASEDVDKSSKVSLPTSPTTATSPAQLQVPPTPPTGPRSSRAGSSTSNRHTSVPAPAPTPAQAPVQRPPKPLPQPSTGAKSAFLKHANPSQGVTEELLRAAFEGFGTLTRCEIDIKKGFGYVDFTDTDGLRKAMHASPIKVANGQVVVLENRTKPPPKNAPPPGVSSPVPAPAQPQSQVAASADNPTPAPVTTAATVPSDTVTAPPTAPKGSTRGGPVSNRGGRGGPFGGPNRENFGPGGRGGPRGGFRGVGRGNAGNRGGSRGGANSNSPAQSSAASVPPAPPSTAT